MAPSISMSACSPLHANINGGHHPRICHSYTNKTYYLGIPTKELNWCNVTRTSIRGTKQRPAWPRAAISDNNADEEKTQVPVSDSSKDDLAAKLAAAEAEAEALRRELAARRGDKEIDISKLKPAVPEKRIDGVGYRETIFSAPGKAIGKEEEQPSKWGLSEAELFLSKGAPSERSQIDGPAMEDNSKEVVTRRLLIGTGITLLATGLAFFKLPTGWLKTSKPLFLYVIPIIRLRDQLKTIENSASDANSVRYQLKKLNDSGDTSKDIFLRLVAAIGKQGRCTVASPPFKLQGRLPFKHTVIQANAAGYLQGVDSEIASSITYLIFDYLNQADYNKYFEYIGQPSASQQLDFLKFSLKSIQAAREQIDKFLSLIPQEDLEAAQTQIMRDKNQI